MMHTLIMMNDGAAVEAMTYDTLWTKYSKRAMLLVLLGDYRGTHLLRVARLVWDTCPALFPEVASAVLECDDVRAAAWDIAALVQDVPGAWDIYTKAQEIARVA